LLKSPPPLLKEKKYIFLLKQPLCFSITLLKISFILLLKQSLVGIITVSAIGTEIISTAVKAASDPLARGWAREPAARRVALTQHALGDAEPPCPLLRLPGSRAASDAAAGLLQLRRAAP